MKGNLTKTARAEKMIGGRRYLWCTWHEEFHPADKFPRQQSMARGYSSECNKGQSERRRIRIAKKPKLPFYLA